MSVGSYSVIVVHLLDVDEQQQLEAAADAQMSSTGRWRRDGRRLKADVVASRVVARVPTVFYRPWAKVIAK